jgi:hypothetical protein
VYCCLLYRVEPASIEGGDRSSSSNANKELSPAQSAQQHAHLFADPNASGDAVKTIGISSHRHNSSSVHSPSQQQLSPQSAAVAPAAAPVPATAAAVQNNNSNSSEVASGDVPTSSEPGSAAGASTGDNAAAAGVGADGEVTAAIGTAGSASVSNSSSKAVKGSLWIRAKTGPLKGQVTSPY